MQAAQSHLARFAVQHEAKSPAFRTVLADAQIKSRAVRIETRFAQPAHRQSCQSLNFLGHLMKRGSAFVRILFGKTSDLCPPRRFVGSNPKVSKCPPRPTKSSTSKRRIGATEGERSRTHFYPESPPNSIAYVDNCGRQRTTANRALGGGSGIRTHDTVSRIHAFQASAFSHSAIPPARERANIAAIPHNPRKTLSD